MRRSVIAALAALLTALSGGSVAQAKTQIAPYIEAQQVLDADFNNGGDVLTYTAVAAGIDGSVTGKRVDRKSVV